MPSELLASPAVPDLPEIISRYLSGVSLQVLAKECAVHRSTLYRWMLTALGDAQYEELVTQCLVNRIAEADGELDEALTRDDIARAREKARFSRMDFERRRPHLYGVKQEVSSKHLVVIVNRDKALENGSNANDATIRSVSQDDNSLDTPKLLNNQR